MSRTTPFRPQVPLKAIGPAVPSRTPGTGRTIRRVVTGLTLAAAIAGVGLTAVQIIEGQRIGDLETETALQLEARRLREAAANAILKLQSWEDESDRYFAEMITLARAATISATRRGDRPAPPADMDAAMVMVGTELNGLKRRALARFSDLGLNAAHLPLAENYGDLAEAFRNAAQRAVDRLNSDFGIVGFCFIVMANLGRADTGAGEVETIIRRCIEDQRQRYAASLEHAFPDIVGQLQSIVDNPDDTTVVTTR